MSKTTTQEDLIQRLAAALDAWLDTIQISGWTEFFPDEVADTKALLKKVKALRLDK